MSETQPMAAFGDFGKWVPGFEFLKGLSQPGGSAAVPPLGHWVAPTLNVEELDKRIQELKTVLFWLEQNATALKATVQAMEVQKMTLATLQGMNVSLQEMAQAFSVPPAAAAPAAAPSAAPSRAPTPPSAKAPSRRRKGDGAEGGAAASPSPAAPASGLVDPMQWWGALTQQFQTIADTALKEARTHSPDLPGVQAASAMAERAGQAMAASAGQAGEMINQALAGAKAAGGQAAARTPARAPAAQPKAAPARQTASRKAAPAKAPKRAR